jgi:hypothetical protein
MKELIFTTLERQIFDWLLAGEYPVLYILRQQLSSSTIKSRQYTGVGFNLYLDVSQKNRDLLKLPNVKPTFCIGDVDVEIMVGNHQQKVGFLLWVKNGYMYSLESYTYGDEKWPEMISEFKIRYLFNQRNLNDLKRSWEL